MATDIMIADWWPVPITIEFLDALTLLDGKAVDLGRVVRVRLGQDYWEEHKNVLEAGGFVQVWPFNQTGRSVPGTMECKL